MVVNSFSLFHCVQFLFLIHFRHLAATVVAFFLQKSMSRGKSRCIRRMLSAWRQTSDHHGEHVQHSMYACPNHYNSISWWIKSATVTVTLILIAYPGRYNLYLQCTLRFPGAKSADNLNNRSTDCAHFSMYLQVETSITGSCTGWFYV